MTLAGAGSGRTATLSARVVWLIAQGLAPEGILLLAFARRASREVLTRTRPLLEARRRSSSTRPSDRTMTELGQDFHISRESLR